MDDQELNSGEQNNNNTTLISTIVYSKKERVKIIDARDIHKILATILNGESELERSREHFWIIGLTDDNWLLSVNTVALGSFNAVIINPLSIFQYVLFQGADYAIIAHNHPSGRVKPSLADIRLTDQLYQFGKLIGTRLRDHVIVSIKKYYSFEKNSKIGEIEKSLEYVLPFKIQADALKKGEAKGMKKGIRVGIDVGERNKAIEMAKEMLADNVDINIIMKYTKLDVDDIDEIKLEILEQE